MADERARIGVVGTGWWSTQHHIPSLKGYERADLVALADPDEGKLRAAAVAYDVSRTYLDYRELLSCDDIDGVVIAVPHAFHFDIASGALEAGKHVMVEKPMVLSAADAWTLVDLAEARGRHLMVGYTYHFTPHARRAYDIVRSGRLGELRFVSGLFASMVESYFRGQPDDYRDVFGFPVTGPGESTYSDPKIAGGGQGMTQITHGMGMVFWLTGQRATEVSSYMENFDLAVDLVDAVSYRLDGGAIGTMGATGTVAPNLPEQQEFRYYGSEGLLLQELVNGKLAFYGNDGTVEEYPDLPEAEIYPAGATSRGLVDLVLDGGANLAPADVGAVTVEFLEAAYASARDGKPVRPSELVPNAARS